MTLYVEMFAVAALLRAIVAWRDARLDAFLLQSGDQPVGVIPTVGDQLLSLREAGEQVSRAYVTARLASGQ